MSIICWLSRSHLSPATGLDRAIEKEMGTFYCVRCKHSYELAAASPPKSK